MKVNHGIYIGSRAIADEGASNMCSEEYGVGFSKVVYGKLEAY